MPQRRRRRGRDWSNFRRRSDEELARIRQANERRRQAARFYSQFRRRGAGGRFLQEAEPLRIKIEQHYRARTLNIDRVSEYELNELSGHELVLRFFSPRSDTVVGALIRMGEVVSDEAREIAPQPGAEHPYSLGSYRDSIHVSEATDRSVSVIAEGGSPSWVTRQPRNYAAFVERGGRTPSGIPTPARHTLERAFHNTRTEQLNAAAEYLRSLF